MTTLLGERRAETSENAVDTGRIIAKILSDRNPDGAKLSNDDLQALRDTLEKKRLNARSVLEKAGRRVENVWIVLNGSLQVTSNGRVLDILSPPAIVGDDLALRGAKAMYTIRAETAVNTLSLPAEKFVELLENSPTLTRAWLGELASKLEYDQVRMRYLLSGDLVTQLAGLLLHRSDDGQVALTQATMASLLNVHRASISRALHLLERQKAIEIGYASVKILDPAKLLHISQNAT